MLYVKLNTNGTTKGNPGPGGRGGIVRDSASKCIFAFFDCFGTVSSMVAETKALLLGLWLCKMFGFSQIMVELDSQVLVAMLRGEYVMSCF